MTIQKVFTRISKNLIEPRKKKVIALGAVEVSFSARRSYSSDTLCMCLCHPERIASLIFFSFIVV